MGELVNRVRKFFSFTLGEFLDLILLGVVGALVFSFRGWGAGDTPEVYLGLQNLAISFFIVLFSMFAHVSVQQILGLKYGYKTTFITSYVSLGLSFVVTALTNGIVPVFIPGRVSLALIPRLRIGHFRYGISYQQNAHIAAWGVFTHLIIALFVNALFGLGFTNDVLAQAALINLVIGFWCVLPIPTCEGVNMLYGGRILYVFWLLLYITLALLLVYTQFWIAIPVALVAAIAGMIYYVQHWEGESGGH